MTDIDETIRYWHAKGLSDVAIGKKLRKSGSWTQTRRQRLRLPSNYKPGDAKLDARGIPLTTLREDDEQVARRERLYAGKRYDCFGG